MGSEWVEADLAECMDAIIDYRGKTPRKTSSGIPLVTAKIIKNGTIQPVSEFIAEEDYDSWMRRGIPEPGDVVMTTEAPLGEVAQLDHRVVALAQRVITLRGKKGVLDNTFLRYLLTSQHVQSQLDGRASGTTVTGIKQSELRKIRLRFPKLNEQKKIGHVLSTLDKKIGVNRQTNQTLESMAQALFKSWFVDFDPVIDNALAAGNEIPESLAAKAAARRALQEQCTDKANQPRTLPDGIRQLFPSRFQFTEELGWIPEGWTNSPLDEVIDLIGGGTPKTSEPNYWGGDIPWFSVVDAPNPSDVFVINTEKRITQSGLANSSARLLPAGTTIISARGTVGKCALAARPMAMNQSCYGVRGKGEISDSYVYYTVFLQVGDLQQRGHGSVFNTITRDTFKTVRIAFGGEHITHAFDELCSTYFNRIKENLIQIDTLSNLRDLLLPKLLSGELRIPEAENKLEATLA